MLEHLVPAHLADHVPDIEDAAASVQPIEKLNAGQTLDAQHKTAKWMQEITKDDACILDTMQEKKVGETFASLALNLPEAKTQILNMQVPEEIRSMVAMVSAHQWKFIEQAEQLRSMAVTKIVQETEHPDARIRLKALEMLGKVTEVALFTERIEVKRAELSDDDLERRIKERLDRVAGIVDAEFTDAVSTDDQVADILAAGGLDAQNDDA